MFVFVFVCVCQCQCQDLLFFNSLEDDTAKRWSTLRIFMGGVGGFKRKIWYSKTIQFPQDQ